MGRRRRNQDSTQVANAEQTVDTQEGQLQVVPSGSENQTETKSVTKPVEEIPYDDRPIPEAYFPPEDESVPEFMPEPNIQKTVIPTVVNYKVVSKKELDALKFEVKTVETNASDSKLVETKSETAKPTAESKNVNLDSLQFSSKQTKTNPVPNSVELGQKTDAKSTPVYTKNFDFNTLQFENKTFSAKTDSANSSVGTLVAPMTITDSLTAKNDSVANDSLATDSIAFVPVQEPEPKREIVSIDGKEIPQTINNMWWYHSFLLVIFVAYVIIIRDRKKAILSELISFVKPNTDGSIFGFQWLQNSKYKFFLSALGVVTASLYLFLANKVAISAIWIFFLAVTVFVLGKKAMLALLEYIYFEGADVASMSGAFMVMVRQAGMALIPAVLGLSFAPEEYRTYFVYFGIIVIVIAFLAFNLKLISNFLKGITSIFYLILYLCTLEVIPLAIFFVLGLLPRL